MNFLFMKARHLALFLAAVMLIGTAAAAAPATVADASYIDDFLNKVGPMCTADMRDHHILASFSLAQAIWESGWGTSTLATEANALFGIRAYGGWDGMVYDRSEKVLYKNWAEIKAVKGEAYVAANTLNFWRAYSSWQESVNDHSDLFNTMSIYENLRGNYDYLSCCTLVVSDGYCGVASYTDCLVSLIRQYDLESYNYDFGGGQQQPQTATVSLKPDTLFMDVDAAYTASVDVSPSGASYTLTSSNSAVVSVSGGTLTAKGEGSATVTLAAGGSQELCHVTVKAGYGGVVADGAYVKCTAKGDSAVVPAEAKSIAADAFKGTNVKTVVVGNGVSDIESGAFNGISGFTLCSYGNSVVSSYALANSIQHVNLSANWTLDSLAGIAMNVPVYTTASVLTIYYSVTGGSAVLKSKNGEVLPENAIVGTGCKITVSGTTYTVMVNGDTDGDGKHSTSDLVIIKSYLSGNDNALPDRAYRRAADFNGDNRITTSDYLAIFINS